MMWLSNSIQIMQIDYNLSPKQHKRQVEKAWIRKVFRDQPELDLVTQLEIAKYNCLDMIHNEEHYDAELLEELG